MIRTLEDKQELLDCGQNLQNAIICLEDLLSKLPEFGYELRTLRVINEHVWNVAGNPTYWDSES